VQPADFSLFLAAHSANLRFSVTVHAFPPRTSGSPALWQLKKQHAPVEALNRRSAPIARRVKNFGRREQLRI